MCSQCCKIPPPASLLHWRKPGRLSAVCSVVTVWCYPRTRTVNDSAPRLSQVAWQRKLSWLSAIVPAVCLVHDIQYSSSINQMLLSGSSEFKGERGVPPFPLVIAVEWLLTLSFFIKSTIAGFVWKRLLLQNALSCIAEATVVIKIALIIWVIFWTETSDAKPPLLNALQPFVWQLGVCWG